jgi:hypothetical protein
MFSKVDVTDIIKDHFLTLLDSETQRISKRDVVFFFGGPLLAGAAGWYFFNLKFNYEGLSTILTASSIFAGLLLNLLVVLFSFADRPDSATSLLQVRRQLIRELNTNISFSILISLCVVMVSLVAVFWVAGLPADQKFISAPATAVLIALLANFVLTLLMILKRMYVVMTEAFRSRALKKSA